MRLLLDETQATALRTVLDQSLAALRVEVRHTDTTSYKQELMAREEALRAIMHQLDTQQAPTS